MRTSAGFHANQPDVYVGSEAQQLCARELLAHHDLAAQVEPDQMKVSIGEPGATTSALRSVVLKPGADTATRYVPIGGSLMRKFSASLAVVVRVSLVPTFSKVMAAPATTAPVLSVRSPAISPVILWAQTGTQPKAAQMITNVKKAKPTRRNIGTA